MSAKSRARAQEERQRLFAKMYPDMPEPDDPPTQVEPELHRLIVWFINNRKQIAENHGCEFVQVSDDPAERIFYGISESKWLEDSRKKLQPTITINYSKPETLR